MDTSTFVALGCCLAGAWGSAVAALKNSKIVWTEPSLAAFIRDPQGTVPGTSMRFFGLGYTDHKIAYMVAYLRTYPATPVNPRQKP